MKSWKQQGEIYNRRAQEMKWREEVRGEEARQKMYEETMRMRKVKEDLREVTGRLGKIAEDSGWMPPPVEIQRLETQKSKLEAAKAKLAWEMERTEHRHRRSTSEAEIRQVRQKLSQEGCRVLKNKREEEAEEIRAGDECHHHPRREHQCANCGAHPEEDFDLIEEEE